MGQYDKYFLYKRQRRVSGTSEWEDMVPTELSYDGNGTMTPIMAEQNSSDCGYSPVIEPIYRWINLNPLTDYYCEDCEEPTPPTPSGETLYSWSATTDYICSGTTKYQKKLEIQSTDSGQTWTLVSPPVSGVGSVIEYNSTDCGYVPPTPTQYKWQNSGYTCSGTSKVMIQVRMQSTDGGQTWQSVVPFTSGYGQVTINSEDCGYEPPSLKFYADYVGGSSYSAECDSNTTLASGDTRPSGKVYSSMTSAVIGDCVTSIGNWAFSHCKSLRSVDIPNSVTSIGEYAFFYCSGLTSVIIPSGVTSINDYTFHQCINLTSCTIGNGVTSIGYQAFYNCSGLTSINIPNRVTSINKNAFWGCSNLLNVTIPNSVTSIGETAFYGCSGMTSCTIGSGVTSIGSFAFGDCTDIQSVYCYPTTPPTAAYPFANNTTCIIYVPSTSVNAYKAASGWSIYADRIQAIP